MHLSYSELEDFLGHLHRVALDKRTALKGRLKHFQRLGWPAGTNMGKGARVQYGLGQTMLLAVGMEMLQLGLTPERVIDQLKYAGSMLASGFAEAFRQYGLGGDPVFYIFSPESLAGLRGIDSVNDAGRSSLMVSRSQIGELLDAGVFRWRRFAFINISDILLEYIDYFRDRGLGSPESLVDPLAHWVDLQRKTFEAWEAASIRRAEHGLT